MTTNQFIELLNNIVQKNPEISNMSIRVYSYNEDQRCLGLKYDIDKDNNKLEIRPIYLYPDKFTCDGKEIGHNIRIEGNDIIIN